MLKKATVAMFSVILAVSLCACSQSNNTTENSVNVESSQTETQSSSESSVDMSVVSDDESSVQSSLNSSVSKSVNNVKISSIKFCNSNNINIVPDESAVVYFEVEGENTQNAKSLIEVVSNNTDITEITISKGSRSILYECNIKALSSGTSEIYVQAKDGSVKSEKRTVNVDNNVTTTKETEPNTEAEESLLQESSITENLNEELSKLEESSTLEHSIQESSKLEPYNPTSTNGFSATGSGDYVADGLEVTEYGILNISHSGERNFVVWAYDNEGNKELLVNKIGAYNGTVLLSHSGTYQLEIKADGNWSIQSSGLSTTDKTSFIGNGDCVTEIFDNPSGKWEIKNNGESNFVVRVYDVLVDKKKLLVNEIGDYSGVVKVDMVGYSFFEVNSSGEWSINKID